MGARKNSDNREIAGSGAKIAKISVGGLTAQLQRLSQILPR
jgi:hypothetical protein